MGRDILTEPLKHLEAPVVVSVTCEGFMVFTVIARLQRPSGVQHGQASLPVQASIKH